ncbi:Outer membrane protein P6 [Ferriphaselus amnicola]|uniref:Outer membrane protein P6 n=1 Tax=Ferriphaselus amnicola TaxID=1188319 RepID=A0A2Z6GB20_9PROT|nr:OmpA family protein [Ferriphaselus amnicola]BBE50634.1 Outer membrane protein P6 [Ferriphaselus amnicola]
MKKIALSGLLLSLLTACASQPKPVAPVEKAPVADATTVKVGTAEIDPLDDPKTGLTYRSLYYALDVDVIQDADKPLVAAHAKYLGSHPARTVRLEGNADERGSNEYNLALAQRRADGVKKLLLLGGAKEGQLTSVSYGEEKPRNTSHDEDGWAENRRTDLNYAK